MNIKIFIVLLFISGPSLAQDIKVEMGPDDKGKALPKNKKDKGKIFAFFISRKYSKKI